MEERFDEFMKKWNAQDLKEANDPEFISIFTDLLRALNEPSDVEFLGNGAYFGTSFAINFESSFRRPSIELEVAIDERNFVVYTGRHNGFWVPAFITLETGNERFEEVRGLFVSTISRIMGLV
jgi:hypothetical protein